MLLDLPTSAQTTLDWSWEHWQPFYAALEAAPIADPAAWLAAWSQVADLLAETSSRLVVATTRNTTDSVAEARYRAFLGDVYPRALAADQVLKRKFLDAGIEPEGFAVPLRNLRAEVELFREANLPLLAEERRLGNEYNRIIGGQTIEWAGRELTIPQTEPLLEEPDRAVREEVWRRAAARQLADREAINQLWRQLLALRRQLAANAGLPDYRAYAWRLLRRFDYTPDDCLHFHEAIEPSPSPRLGGFMPGARRAWGLTGCVPGIRTPALYTRRRYAPFATAPNSPSGARRCSCGWMQSWGAISPPCAARDSSTSTIARARRPAATAPTSPLCGGLSSS